MSCKVFIYFNYAFDAISPWLLVYISVEKLISIGYPHKRHLLTEIISLNLFTLLSF